MSQAPQANGSGAGTAAPAAPGVAALMGERPIDCLPLKVTLRAFWGMIKSYWVVGLIGLDRGVNRRLGLYRYRD